MYELKDGLNAREGETMELNNIKKTLEERKDRSAWDKGVTLYALELLETIEECDVDLTDRKAVRKAALNGAENWLKYSYGGCSLIYDCDIAERLCSPSVLKRVDGGNRNPSRCENWLDVQARALAQAFNVLMWAIRKETK